MGFGDGVQIECSPDDSKATLKSRPKQIQALTEFTLEAEASLGYIIRSCQIKSGPGR